MGVGDNKVMLNIEKYGNTTNGTIPLCLWEWENQLKKGDNITCRLEEDLHGGLYMIKCDSNK